MQMRSMKSDPDPISRKTLRKSKKITNKFPNHFVMNTNTLINVIRAWEMYFFSPDGGRGAYVPRESAFRKNY